MTSESNGKVGNDERTRDAASHDAQRDILDIEGAAELLGISVKTFNKVLHQEDMPGRKIGREWKFSRRALIDWVGRGRSRDFYDRQDDDGERPDGYRTDEVTPHAPAREKARRTAGWSIEYQD